MNFSQRTIVAVPEVSARPSIYSSPWVTHLIALGALVGLLGLLNASAVAAAVEVWWGSTAFTHCFLVAPISAYLIWRRRRLLASLTPSAYPLALLLAPPLMLFLLVGKLASINEAEQLALIGLLQVLIVAVLGPHVYRKIIFPSLFLFFLVPMGEYFVGPLQRFTTDFVSSGLRLLNIPHYRESTFIKLSNGTYEVAEACAGLRFLIATIVIGVLFVHLNYRKWYKIALFLIACLVVPVIANGFRALGIVLLGYWSDNRIAQGFDHIVYGYGFLVAILLVLMLIGSRYADPLPQEELGPSLAARVSSPRGFLSTIILSLAAVSFVPSYLYWQSHKPSSVNAAAFSAPLSIPGWQTGRLSGGWSPDYAPPDAQLAIAMHEARPDSYDVDAFINYYAKGKVRGGLLSADNKLWSEDVWHPVSDGAADAELSGRSVHLRESVVSSGGLRRIIWWTYWSGGRFTTSKLDVKLDPLRHVFSGGNGTALVAFSTPVIVDLADARARLRRAVESLGQLPARLNEAGR
jgi:exosortase A